MPEIIKEGHLVQKIEYRRSFVCREDPASGYSFPCDEHGSLAEMSSAARLNYEKCQAHPEQYEDRGVQRLFWTYWDPAILRCDCGAEVVLDDSFLNTCRCGRDFDGAGHLLAPRSQWGEETGESLADILTGRGKQD